MRTRSSRWAPGLCCALLAVLGALPILAQSGRSDRELRSALEERFEILPLRDGVLLQPRDETESPRSIEVGPDGIFLDGAPASADELEVRLGDEAAALVERLAALGVDELHLLATGGDLEADVGEAEKLREEARAEAREEAENVVEESRAEHEEAAHEARERLSEVREKVRSERRVRRDTQVVIANSHTVEADEISEDVLVVGGPLRVDGKVDGDAVALGGSVTIDGEVTGDVSAVGGTVHLESNADVHGDVVSVGGQVTRDPDARVGGRIEEVPFRWHISGDWDRDWFDAGDYDFDFSPWHHWMRVGWRVFWVLFVALLACITLLVARRPVERMERRIEHEPWKAGLTGLLAQVLAIPVLVLVCVVLAISIIGIPVLLLVPFALVFIGLAAFGGFVAMARAIGRWLERRFGKNFGGPYAEALAGLALIYVFSLFGHLLNAGPLPLRFLAGMSLVLGTLVWYAAWTIGFGAAILTRFGTAASWERAGGREPLPPVPDVPEPGEPLEEQGDWTAEPEPGVDDERSWDEGPEPRDDGER